MTFHKWTFFLFISFFLFLFFIFSPFYLYICLSLSLSLSKAPLWQGREQELAKGRPLLSCHDLLLLLAPCSVPFFLFALVFFTHWHREWSYIPPHVKCVCVCMGQGGLFFIFYIYIYIYIYIYTNCEPLLEPCFLNLFNNLLFSFPIIFWQNMENRASLFFSFFFL